MNAVYARLMQPVSVISFATGTTTHPHACLGSSPACASDEQVEIPPTERHTTPPKRSGLMSACALNFPKISRHLILSNRHI